MHEIGPENEEREGWGERNVTLEAVEGLLINNIQLLYLDGHHSEYTEYTMGPQDSQF